MIRYLCTFALIVYLLVPQITCAYTVTNFPQHQTVEQDAGTIQITIVNDELSPASLAHTERQGIIVKPSDPVTDEPIRLAVSGSATSCEPAYLSHIIENQIITVQIGVPEWVDLCGTSEWTEEFEIGMLAAGTYRVDAYVRLFEDESFMLLHTLDFTVEGNVNGTFDGMTTVHQHHIFMPIIKMNRYVIPSQPCSDEALLAKIC